MFTAPVGFGFRLASVGLHICASSMTSGFCRSGAAFPSILSLASRRLADAHISTLDLNPSRHASLSVLTSGQRSLRVDIPTWAVCPLHLLPASSCFPFFLDISLSSRLCVELCLSCMDINHLWPSNFSNALWWRFSHPEVFAHCLGSGFYNTATCLILIVLFKGEFYTKRYIGMFYREPHRWLINENNFTYQC